LHALSVVSLCLISIKLVEFSYVTIGCFCNIYNVLWQPYGARAFTSNWFYPEKDFVFLERR
jgi:hypothetical protein